MKTTAAVLNSANAQISIEELDIAPLRPRELLVRIVGSGVCHTDLGVIAAPGDGQLPIVLGHEGSGVIERVGTEVTFFAPGDHVVLSYASCEQCDNCGNGLPQYCRDFLALNMVGARLDGTTPLSRDGVPVLGAWFGQSSWAQYAVVAEGNAVKVDDDLPLELLGPLGCGIQTGAGAVLNTLKPEPGSSIAIFAVGSVGLAAMLAAKTAGCATIIAVDVQASRLAKAAELGATHTVNSAEVDAAEAIRGITGGLGVNYSVDCIGVPAVIRSALEALRTPGVCATVGFQGLTNNVAIDHGQLLFGRTLVGVIEGDAVPAEFIPRMIRLYRQGLFPFDRMIDTFAFGDINKAIEAIHSGAVVKAVLTGAFAQ